MIKNTIKFEVSFDLLSGAGETLDKDSIKNFQETLKAWIQEYNDYHGSFYVYGPNHDTTIDATNVRVRRIK